MVSAVSAHLGLLPRSFSFLLSPRCAKINASFSLVCVFDLLVLLNRKRPAWILPSELQNSSTAGPRYFLSFEIRSVWTYGRLCDATTPTDWAELFLVGGKKKKVSWKECYNPIRCSLEWAVPCSPCQRAITDFCSLLSSLLRVVGPNSGLKQQTTTLSPLRASERERERERASVGRWGVGWLRERERKRMTLHEKEDQCEQHRG